MPKRNNAFIVVSGIVMAGILSLAVSYAKTAEHFSVKEYNDFHEVLHPLQHDALPNKDYKAIRARAAELVTLGEAIVKLEVPPGVADSAEFTKALGTFKAALVAFRNDAANAPDAQLETSYLALHDSFETLAEMLPRKKG